MISQTISTRLLVQNDKKGATNEQSPYDKNWC